VVDLEQLAVLAQLVAQVVVVVFLAVLGVLQHQEDKAMLVVLVFHLLQELHVALEAAVAQVPLVSKEHQAQVD
jgi:hypothetical protein